MQSEIKKFSEDIALLIVSVIFIYFITRLLHQIHSFHQETIEQQSKKMKNLREANEKYLKFLGAKKDSIPRDDREKRLKAIIAVHQKTVARATKRIEEKSNNGVVVVGGDNDPKIPSLAREDPKSVVERVVSKLDAQEIAPEEETRLGDDDYEDGFEKIPAQPLIDFSYVDPDFDVQTYLEEDEPSIGGVLGSDGGAETSSDVLVSEEKELQSEVASSLSRKEKVRASSSVIESEWDWVVI